MTLSVWRSPCISVVASAWLILADVEPCLGATICKQTPSRIVKHNVVNDIIVRSLSSAGIPAAKEPTGLTRLDGKRPDGLTLVPWQEGKPVTWDITVVSTLAQSSLHASGHSAAGAAQLAASRKEAKYSCLPRVFSFCTNRA